MKVIFTKAIVIKNTTYKEGQEVDTKELSNYKELLEVGICTQKIKKGVGK